MTHQRKWQKAQRAKGCCVICGKPAAQSKRGLSQWCEGHRDKNRAYMRQYARGRTQP